MSEAAEENQATEAAATEQPAPEAPAEAAPAPEVGGGGGEGGGGAGEGGAQADPKEREIEAILDIPLRINVELGRSKILVNDLIKLHQGSVLELNKSAGEPLDVLVNDKIVARGEVIVVNERFGIRLTDIVNHTERIRQLGE